MNENLEMLEYLHKASDMGKTSTEDLLKELKEKDNKIKKTLEEINKKYEYFEKESSKLLKKQKTVPKKSGIITDIMSKMGIKQEVKKDNSDPSIASMLIQGLTMGNLEIDKRIKSFEKELDKNIINLAKEFRKFGEIYIENLKNYL